MSTRRENIARKFKETFLSIDQLFIIFGILLNGASTVISLIEGHIIAGLILGVCEIVLIVAFILKIL